MLARLQLSCLHMVAPPPALGGRGQLATSPQAASRQCHAGKQRLPCSCRGLHCTLPTCCMSRCTSCKQWLLCSCRGSAPHTACWFNCPGCLSMAPSCQPPMVAQQLVPVQDRPGSSGLSTCGAPVWSRWYSRPHGHLPVWQSGPWHSLETFLRHAY